MGTDAATLRDLAGEIEWAKASLVAPAEYPAAVARLRRDVPGPAEQVAAVYAGYEEAKNAAELLDFDDLLLHVAGALEGHARHRAGVPRPLPLLRRRRVPGRHPAAAAGARRLARRARRPHRGRRRQPDDLHVRRARARSTCWSSRGASPRPSSCGCSATTAPPRRSSACANTLIGAARDRPAGTRLRLIGQRPAGPDPDFTEHDDEVAEAAAVATRIRRMVADGVPPSEIAVLFRVNAQSETYEQALTEAGVPYQVRGGERFFHRPEIRRAMSVVRMAGAGTGRLGRRRARRARARRPHPGSARRRGAAGAVGVAARARRAGRGARGRRAGGRPAPLRRRARDPGRRGAPAHRPGRHARVAARGEGPGVGRRVPGRARRRHAADPARRWRRARDRGGAPPALRRHHPGPAAGAAVVGARPAAGRGAAASAQPLPLRAGARAPPGVAHRRSANAAGPSRAAGSAVRR